MELKELNYYLSEWEEIEKNMGNVLDEKDIGHSPSNDYNPTSMPKRLTRASGRQYVMQSPAVIRTTRKDKMNLLKEKDVQKVMPVIENSFQIMIAAARGTDLEQFVISRVNVVRQQLQKKYQNIMRRK